MILSLLTDCPDGTSPQRFGGCIPVDDADLFEAALMVAALIALVGAHIWMHVRWRGGRRRLQAREQEERGWQALDEEQQWRRFARAAGDEDEHGDANQPGRR